MADCVSAKIQHTPSRTVVLRVGSAYRSDLAILFLHGFPGKIGNRNLDLAEAVFAATGANVFLPHYRGLGFSDGLFSFTQSVTDTLNIAEDLLIGKKFKKIFLVGHSWGGFVALNLLAKQPLLFSHTVLLSPLFAIPERSRLEKLAPTLLNDHREILSSKSDAALVAEFEEVRAKFKPLDNLSGKTRETCTILQALHDLEIPASINQKLAHENFPAQNYTEVDQDHRFQKDRPGITKQLIEVILSHL